MSNFVIENGVLKKYTGNGGDVVIPENVEKIGRKAFFCDIGITSVTIPDTVKVMEENVFSGCVNLTAVRLSNCVERLEFGTFSNCTALTSIVIPDSVRIIGNGVFAGCTSLEIFTVGDNVKSIGTQAFFVCKNLKAVNIPESAFPLGMDAFSYCKNLKELSINGYIVRKNFGEVENLTGKLNQVIFMLHHKDFSVSMESEMKYPFIVAYYLKTQDETALTYIKRQFSKIVTYMIEQNDIEAIEALTEVENLFTKKNIDKLIQTAIDNQRHEIYVILLNYKAEKLGFKDIKDQFKL
ncbi:MAG: leucine-rich repeat domain-containing protein [Oscillospiraceae bacterium]